MPERFETWDDQVKLQKIRQAAPTPPLPAPQVAARSARPQPASAESEELLLLRRIARATEKTSNRLLGIGLMLFLLMIGLFLGWVIGILNALPPITHGP